jgi:hypothetical protein
MRLRNETLRTGNLLAWFDSKTRTNNRSLLFLVAGASDITPLTNIEEVCREIIEEKRLVGFEWFPVPDLNQLASVERTLDSSKLLRVEAHEFLDVDRVDLRSLLEFPLELLARGENELFPSAQGAVGAPAEGIQFLDRTKDVEAIKSLLHGGHNILLQAPRRSGKSSLMKYLEASLKNQYLLFYYDLQSDNSFKDMAVRFWVKILEQKTRLAERRADTEGPKVLLSEALHKLNDQGAEPLVLLFDELVMCLENLMPTNEEARKTETLEFLGALSEKCEEVNARVLVAGSLDFFEYLREKVGLERADLPDIWKNINKYALSPLTSDSVKLELRRVFLGTGLVLEEGEEQWLLDNIDLSLPYQALQFLDELASKARSFGTIPREKLYQYLDTFLLNTEAFDEFDKRTRRKEAQLPGAKAATYSALDLLARDNAEAGQSTNLVKPLFEGVNGGGEDLFFWFIETFPVYQEGDKLVLASRLFKRWWKMQDE